MELSTVVAVAELLQKEKKTFRLGPQKKHDVFDAKNNFYSKLMKKPSKNQLRYYPTGGVCLFVRTLLLHSDRWLIQLISTRFIHFFILRQERRPLMCVALINGH